MPRTVAVHLHLPTKRKEVLVRKRLKLDGWYVDDMAEVKVPLAPGAASTAGRVALQDDTLTLVRRDLAAVQDVGGIIHVDVERGVQLVYDGLDGWTGIDGRFTYAANAKAHAQDLQTRGSNTQRWIWPLVIVFLGLVLALIIVASLAVT